MPVIAGAPYPCRCESHFLRQKFFFQKFQPKKSLRIGEQKVESGIGSDGEIGML
jgi:hypothetical protein